MPNSKELKEAMDAKFLNRDNFAEDIERLVLTSGMNYIDAIEYCNIHNIEIESVGKLVSKPLKEKLRYTKQLNYLKESSGFKSQPPSDTMHLSGFDVYRTFLAISSIYQS